MYIVLLFEMGANVGLGIQMLIAVLAKRHGQWINGSMLYSTPCICSLKVLTVLYLLFLLLHVVMILFVLSCRVEW
jgi:quinol-cytochrome oxidoreductase complex cytochrome b subunit